MVSSIRGNVPAYRNTGAIATFHMYETTSNPNNTNCASNNNLAPKTSETNLDVSKAPDLMSLPAGYPTTCEKFTSYRYRLCYIMILALSLVSSQTNSMAFALVCMTGGNARTNLSQNIGSGNIFTYKNNSDDMNLSVNFNVTVSKEETDSADITEPEFSWDSATQGFILSSAFYAAIVSPFISSVLSRRFGPKIVIVTAMFIAGLTSLLTPVLARTSVYLVIACRVVLGFVLNMIFPASQDLWAHWAPVQDKAQLLALTFSGNNIANMVTFSVSGFLCTIPVQNGWPFIFYFFGSLAICWCVLWTVAVHDTPETHPSISEVEKRYIIENRQGVNSVDKKPKIPWKPLLTSSPMWAYVFVFFCHAYTSSLLFNYLPTYMSTVLDFEITQNGLLSSVPYVTRFVGMVTWTILSGALISHLSVTTTRKIIQAIGSVGSTILTLGIINVPIHLREVAVVLFALLTPLQSASVSGAIVTTLDFAPQFASVSTAFGTVGAVISQLVSAQVTSLIIVDRTKEQWNTVFYLSIGLYILALVVFLIFGSGELQSWADNSSAPTKCEPDETRAHVNRAYEPDDHLHNDLGEYDGETRSKEMYITHL